MRPEFDNWMLMIAAMVSLRSRDPSTKCGAVIVRPDKSIVSVGYNGFPRAMEDRVEWYEDRTEKYDRVIHSEMNALLSAKESVVGYTMYVTGPMCKDCTKHVIAAGITRVVWAHNPEFHERWGCERSVQLLEESGVELVSIG
jgi:dCMP deaminase